MCDLLKPKVQTISLFPSVNYLISTRDFFVSEGLDNVSKVLDNIVFDYVNYPYNHYEFTYKNYHCQIKRNRSGAYLAYIDLKTQEDKDNIDMSLINRDITWEFGNYGIGFDYQHAGDITPLELIDRCQRYEPDSYSNDDDDFHNSDSYSNDDDNDYNNIMTILKKSPIIYDNESFKSISYVCNDIKTLIDYLVSIK